MEDTTPTKSEQQRLGRLRLRNTQGVVASTKKYSRAVDLLRWLLPVIVVIGLAVLLLWPMWQANRISAVMVDNVPNLMVDKLNLTGTDQKGQPFALTADRALQAANAKNIVDLERPNGEITLQSGAWVAGHADKGRIDQLANKLWLSGNVELFHDEGYRFSSDEMNVDIGKSEAWGQKPVIIQGGFGRIEGVGFHLEEGGRKITVLGPAKARLSLRRLSQSDKPNVKTSRSR